MYKLSTRFLPLRYFSTLPPRLSGHNKWSKIKQKKGANDLQKSIAYGKANQEIMQAVKIGGSVDPELNAKLALVIKRAKEQGVPKENIAKALAKATQRKNNTGESLTYEAMAFNSVGLIIECLTDNVNRTLHDIREILTKHNTRFTPVKFMFQRKGYIKVALLGANDSVTEGVIDAALAGGAEDFQDISELEDGTAFRFICAPEVTAQLASELESYCKDSPAEVQESDLMYIPTEAQDTSEEEAHQLAALVEDLEDNDDTLRVWTTLD